MAIGLHALLDDVLETLNPETPEASKVREAIEHIDNRQFGKAAEAMKEVNSPYLRLAIRACEDVAMKV